MLRANDLIWSFVINNYLLGRDPFPFDLLHWNCDSTRMPAKMHSFYLRNMYMNNLLREPGALTLAGTPIDLSKVKVPTYFVSAIEDHIAPWKTTYAGPQLLERQDRASCCRARATSPAWSIRRPRTSTATGRTTSCPPIADEWLDGAKQHEGSWWTDWREWIDAVPRPRSAARACRARASSR